MNIEKHIVATGFSPFFFFFRIHVIQIFQGFLVKGEFISSFIDTHAGFPRYIPTLSGVSVASWQIFSGVWCGLCGVARYQEPCGKRGFYKFSEVRRLRRGYTIKSGFFFTSGSPIPCKMIIQIECLRLYVYTGGVGGERCLVSPAKPPETRL